MSNILNRSTASCVLERFRGAWEQGYKHIMRVYVHGFSILMCTCFVCLYFIRVFIEFERQRSVHPHPTDVAQPVQEAVYIALKKRQDRNKFFLYTKEDRSSKSSERRRQSFQGDGGHREREEAAAVSSSGSAGVVRSIPSVDLPDLGTQQIMITEVIDVSFKTASAVQS